MSRRQICVYPDEVLKKVAASVESFDETLHADIVDLTDTMEFAAGSVGIAAPQIGISRRIIIVDTSSKPQFPSHGRLVLINPEITQWKGYGLGREGCLSVPDYTGNVIRAKNISVLAYNEQGEQQDYEFESYEARAVQHEIDHLDGILFLDRLVSRRNDLFLRKKTRD